MWKTHAELRTRWRGVHEGSSRLAKATHAICIRAIIAITAFVALQTAATAAEFGGHGGKIVTVAR